MNFRERVYSVLIVSSSEKFNGSISGVLDDARFFPVKFVSSASSARRQLLENSFDIVVINTPLKDDFGISLALDVCEKSGAGVLMFVKAEHYDDVNSKVCVSGALTLPKPANSVMVSQSISLLCATRERLMRMEQKTASVEEKMAEIRLVNRAKLILIEQLKMTEKEAHRFIEKQAMDRCETRRSVAEKIITTYQ